MKKIPLLILAVTTVLFFQNCKKSSTDDATTTTTYTLQATVNGVSWTPDTLSANITYNVAAKTKVFNFTGTYSQRRVTCAVTLNNATSANDFTLAGYNVDDSGNPLMTYSFQQKDATGNLVFVPVATAASNDGIVTVTAIDVTKKLITGTFSFSSKKNNYDSDGNVISISNNVVSAGIFTNMPYTFVSN